MKFLKKINYLKIFGYLAAILLGIIVSLTIVWITRPEPWDPLGPYPQQSIVTEGDTLVKSQSMQDTLIPITSLSNGNIIVAGTKCSKETVEVSVYYGWWSNSPGGFHVRADDGPPGKRLKGCESFTFENEIPQEVEEWIQSKLDAGVEPEMYLSGCETPINDKGVKGTEVCWTTETFAFKK